MLEIKNLHATIAGKEILKGLNLTIHEGEVHAIMGPNGAGKSTLSNVLTGHPAYTVTEGEVIFRGKNLLDMAPEVRAREGIFLSFQYPVEIPGVSVVNFMRTAVNEKRQHEGKEPLKAAEFLKLMRGIYGRRGHQAPGAERVSYASAGRRGDPRHFWHGYP